MLPVTVLHVARDLARHPHRRLIARWNWKSAVLSAAMRGGIFFATNLTFGLDAAFRALAVDACFRIPLVGLYAAVTQAFTAAEPVWVASIAVTLLLTTVAHTCELVIHWIAGTPGVGTGVIVSVAWSAVSSVFTLFAMRRGVLVVGDAGASPLREDLRRLPRLVLDFLCLGLR